MIQRKRATNSPIRHVDIGNPDDENDSDENEKKMKVIIFSLTLDYTKSSVAAPIFLTTLSELRVGMVSS